MIVCVESFSQPGVALLETGVTMHGLKSPDYGKQHRVQALIPAPDCSMFGSLQSEFPPLRDEPYDLVVLGSGPGGEAAAVQAARLGASVAVVEVKKAFGGPTGLTSKAVREASIQINQAVKNVRGCVSYMMYTVHVGRVKLGCFVHAEFPSVRRGIPVFVASLVSLLQT